MWYRNVLCTRQTDFRPRGLFVIMAQPLWLTSLDSLCIAGHVSSLMCSIEQPISTFIGFLRGNKLEM